MNCGCNSSAVSCFLRFCTELLHLWHICVTASVAKGLLDKLAVSPVDAWIEILLMLSAEFCSVYMYKSGWCRFCISPVFTVSECLVDFIKLLDYKKTKLISDGDDMSCIKTYTGVMFDPLNPDSDSIFQTDL